MALYTIFAAVLLGFCLNGHAIVFYSSGNDYNLSDPGGGLPWQNVVEVRSSSGLSGTGVYLGNRYVLTAAHVGPTEVIRINGAEFSLEPTAPIQIGTADMKLLRLQADPGLGRVFLNTVAANDGGSARMVGYGVGRSPSSPLSASPVSWGDVSTVAKRWGINTVDGAVAALTSGTYTSSALITQFNTNMGPNEAALTLYDSGAALFRSVGSQWVLVGLGAYVAANGASYANPSSISGSQIDDNNYFIRISSYANAQDMLGGVAVPEPGTSHLLMFALGVYSMMRRRAR